MRVGGVIAVLVAVVAVAASEASPAPSSAVAREAAARDCSASEGRQLVLRFVRAFNTGNARLDALFAADDGDGDAGTPGFQWFSTGKPGARVGPAAYDRSTLIRYFAARHRDGERLRLLWLSRGGNANGYFHFGFHLVRRTRDLSPRPYEGKGAAVCSESGARIAVWSVGPPIGPPLG